MGETQDAWIIGVLYQTQYAVMQDCVWLRNALKCVSEASFCRPLLQLWKEQVMLDASSGFGSVQTVHSTVETDIKRRNRRQPSNAYTI